jgi:hypothetical protein
MENKKEIIRAMNNLTFNVIKKVKEQEDVLIEKVLIEYLSKKPTRKQISKVAKIIDEAENYTSIIFEGYKLGVIKYEMTKDKGLSIRFMPNAIK